VTTEQEVIKNKLGLLNRNYVAVLPFRMSWGQWGSRDGSLNLEKAPYLILKQQAQAKQSSRC